MEAKWADGVSIKNIDTPNAVSVIFIIIIIGTFIYTED